MQTRKEGPGSRPVGPDEEEVAGASDDDYYTSDREEATIKFSFPDRKSVKKISDEELLMIVSEGHCRRRCHRCRRCRCRCCNRRNR